MLRLEDPAVRDYIDSIKKHGLKCPHCNKWIIKSEREIK